jgi:predicted glycogen debranching enzyme
MALSTVSPREAEAGRSHALQVPLPLLVPSQACRDLATSGALEWLETDGRGGFAMGTAAGLPTRRYHALLVSALAPPAGRHVLLSRFDETVTFDDGTALELATVAYPDVIHPRGFEALESFRIDPFPRWTYELAGARIEKRVFLVRDRGCLVVQYRAERAGVLRVRPLLAYRDFHALSKANGAIDGRFEETNHGAARRLVLAPYPGLPRLVLDHPGHTSAEGSGWYYRTWYSEEASRGLDAEEDLYCLGTLEIRLAAGEVHSIVVSTDPDAPLATEAVARAHEREERKRRTIPSRDPVVGRLSLAADDFLVRRADGAPTVIAGYPWFADWGRDTMIALPGLLVARGRLEETKAILRTFLAHLDRGILPNRFPDDGAAPEYNTADASFWLFPVVDAYLRAGGDAAFVRDEVYPAALEILRWHERGSHFGIRIDPSDGLVVAGGPGTQLTWMDAKIGDWVVTPRHGKAVEINALYFFALRFLEELARAYGRDADAAGFARKAERVRSSFLRTFWNAEGEWLFDVVFSDGPDWHFRPNQIFAVSLRHSALSAQQQVAVVRAVERRLLTPYGLRTLAMDHDEYRPRYGGSSFERDAAYHQGTVWPWLLGPFVSAYLRAFGRGRAQVAYATSLLAPLERHLADGCLGSLGELFDGSAPHRPGGAPAQAWTVGELLRVLLIELRDG